MVAVPVALLTGGAQAQQTTTYTESRLSQFERSISDLRGRLDQLRQQNQHLQQEVDKMRTSHEQRLQALEKGPAKAPVPAKARASTKN